MRIARLAALLLIAVGITAAQNQSNDALKFQPKFDLKAPVRGPDGVLRFMPNSQQVGALDDLSKGDLARYLKDRQSGNTCYFIRSYVMKRDDDTDAMRLDHVTTCTPMSRFQMKKTVRVLPAIQR